MKDILRHPATPYVAPFAIFLAFLVLQPQLAALGEAEFPLRVAILAGVIWYFSRGVLDFRCKAPVASILFGLAVFALWIAPDVLFPGWRQHWLFSNSITGGVKTSIPEGLTFSPLVLVFRTLRAALIVPIVEELFWRGWLMRWLIKDDFEKVPLGTYHPKAFWITAVLFAVEHGPYWEVGLVTGVLYNWWMVRTKSLGDLILVHGVTNLALSLYVIYARQWQYWM